MTNEAAMHNYLQKKSPKVLRDYVEKFGTVVASDLGSLNTLFFYLSYITEKDRPEFRVIAAAVAIKYNGILNVDFYKNLPEKMEEISPADMMALPFSIAERARVRARVAKLEELYGLVRIDAKDLEKELANG